MVVTGVQSDLGESIWIDQSGAPTQLYWAGGVDITVNGYNRVVFCVDLLTHISLDTYDTTLDYSDTPYIRDSSDYSDVDSLLRVGYLLKYEWPKSALQGAALQLAIWDIVTDKGDGFGKPDTSAGIVSQSTDTSHPTDPGVLSAAIAYEAEAESLVNPGNFGIVYHNYQGTGPNRERFQTLMGPNPTDLGPEPLPEPSALLLIIFQGIALTGVGSLCALRRRARTN